MGRLAVYHKHEAVDAYVAGSLYGEYGILPFVGNEVYAGKLPELLNIFRLAVAVVALAKSHQEHTSCHGLVYERVNIFRCGGELKGLFKVDAHTKSVTSEA